MTNKFLLFNFLILISTMNYAQTLDKGNFNIHYGTLLVYQTYSIGYEGFDLLRNGARHSVRPVLRIGSWSAALVGKNLGMQTAIGASYLLGKGSHKFEHSSELVLHFDKSLRSQSLSYIASLYRPFIGYRYEPAHIRFIARVGMGWKEVLQIGIGYRL